MNLVVLAGQLSRPPRARTLPSGTTLVEYQLTTRSPDGTARTVPVSWADPPARAPVALGPGTTVVVLGQVRRRFFRAGGATRSATEVEAERVVRGDDRRAVARLLAAAARALAAA